MSVTYGFYNSLNGDRRYDAIQITNIFNGLISDGIFATIGTCFVVKADVGIDVTVGIGRAWFNSTWTLNDSILPLTAPVSDVLLERIDAVVIEVNKSEAVRANSIKFVQGVPSSSPVNPILTNEGNTSQYPLCYVYRPANSNLITQAQITNVIGTIECPFVAGIIDTVDISVLLGQWDDQFHTWLDNLEEILDENVAGNLLNLINQRVPIGATWGDLKGIN